MNLPVQLTSTWSRITGFFAGGWISYLAVAVLAGAVIGVGAWKTAKAFDAAAYSSLQHKYDVSNGQNAVLVTQINLANARIATAKVDSERRIKAAIAAQKAADARAAALNHRADTVLSFKPGPDMDVAIAQVALKGLQ